MREHGCSILGFVVGLPLFAVGYVIVNRPDVWFGFLDVLTVLLIVLWFLVSGYLVLTVIMWLKHRREARTPVSEPTYDAPQAQAPAKRGGPAREQGRGKQAVELPRGGRHIL